MTVKRLVRALAACHRWLGALLCVPFAIWFASGFVMLFAGFPGVSDGDSLERSVPLAAPRLKMSLEQVMAQLGFMPESVRLVMLGGVPTWRIERDGEPRVLDAEGGSRVTPLTEAAAARAALSFLGTAATAARLERLVEPDQWTPLAARRGQLPLLRVRADDALGSEIYVALERAEIVQHTTLQSRTLAWLGAIPHWWYPVQLRRHGAIWRWVVLVGSGVGVAVCVLGLALGVIHFRRRAAAALTLRWSPYSDGWLRYHHLVGLAFGTLALTWVFSGMLSLNPGRWSPGPFPTPAQDEAFHAPPANLQAVTLPAALAVERCSSELSVKALELVHVLGEPYWLCQETWSSSRIVAAGSNNSLPMPELPSETLTRAAAAAMGSWPLASARLERGDDYVYPTHLDPELRLPLLRFDFERDQSLYVDPHSGQIVRRHDPTTRLERWLYQGLHRLDFAVLFQFPWVWRGVVAALCLGGAAFSFTGMLIGWRWMFRRERRAARNAGRR